MDNSLVTLAKQIATSHGLDPALVCAVVEQESNWEPWSIRYEDAFYHRYVDPTGTKYSSTEARAEAFSWGLMQLMGGVARELGFTGKIASLCDPATGLEWGCRKLAKCISGTTDIPSALLRWNGGGNASYASQVLARVDKYK